MSTVPSRLVPVRAAGLIDAARDRRHRTTVAVLGATGLALVLHLIWLEFLAGTGGDLAAQDAWTGFALAHPSSAYDFAWYGGMHPASYSLISPYVMGLLGVRVTMLLAGTVSVGLVTLLLSRLPAVAHPGRAAVYAAVAITGNAVSGRATFGLGLAFGLGALALALVKPPWPRGPWAPWLRGAVVTVLAGLATASSPVAGLFLGLVAAALWVRGRRRVALALGVAPVVIVVGTALLFPFFGVQPFPWKTALLPLVLAVAGWVVLPRGWRLARICSAIYGASVLALWLVPTPIGTNIARMSLLFGGVVLVAAASGAWWTSPAAQRLGRPAGRVLLLSAILTATVWQVVIAGDDVAGSASASALGTDVSALVGQLDARGADQGRVEVVPSRSHREASALAPYVNLARGWNRQADVARNAVFYSVDHPMTSRRYLRWLRSMAVRLVVVPSSTLDYAGVRERRLISHGLPYLREVWSDPTWTLYEVTTPAPMVRAPATLVRSDAASVTVQMPTAGSTVLRIAWSPWLSIVDAEGRRLDDAALGGSCLEQLAEQGPHATSRVVLRAAEPGTFRIAAPYSVPRGTPCVS